MHSGRDDADLIVEGRRDLVLLVKVICIDGVFSFEVGIEGASRTAAGLRGKLRTRGYDESLPVIVGFSGR